MPLAERADALGFAIFATIATAPKHFDRVGQSPLVDQKIDIDRRLQPRTTVGEHTKGQAFDEEEIDRFVLKRGLKRLTFGKRNAVRGGDARGILGNGT